MPTTTRRKNLGVRQNIFSNLFPRPDGKPVLSGLPNAYSDAEGRPFGFVDELREIGWPASSEGGEKMQLENLLVACAPREGGEGSWLYAHHCCASWSDGVVMNKQVSLIHFHLSMNHLNISFLDGFRGC